MNTYTRTFIICPHCGGHTNSSIDHFATGQSFGPWYCDVCGGGYKGKAAGADTQVEKIESRFSKTLDLLMLEPHDSPTYFVVAGKRYAKTGDEDESEGKAYFYEEQSCPTNWIGNTVMICVDGDTDPHGFLKFVRFIPSPSMPHDPNAEEKTIIAAFPEVAPR